MDRIRQGWRRRAALAGLAIAASAWGQPASAQPADPDAPLPTARYERPPEGVNPAILSEPLPEPPPPPPAADPAPAVPTIKVPEAPTVRRRGVLAPASLETPTAAPQERPWDRPAVEARAPAPVQAYAEPPAEPSAPAAPKPVRAAPAGRMIELQIGAFADRGNAERAARAAKMAGPTRIQAVTVGGVTYHRVIVGPAREPALRSALTRLGFADARPPRPS